MPTIKCAITVLIASFACVLPGTAAEATTQSGEKERCRQQLEKIHAAVQEYRKEHKEMPGNFHDLVPKFISDKSLFLCPKGQKENADHPLPWLADPKLKSHYIYEFSSNETGESWGGGRLRMADWKALQMGILGGTVPLARCFMHRPVLNVSFDGKFFESQPNWEVDQVSHIHHEDVTPAGLRLRLAEIMKSIDEETLAMDRLRYASMQIERMSAGNKLDGEAAEKALATAEAALKFQGEYPQSKLKNEAHGIQINLLFLATQQGNAKAKTEFEKLVESSRGNNLPEETRTDIRIAALFIDGSTVKDAKLEQPARALAKEFPKQPQPYYLLMAIAESADAVRGRTLASDLLKMEEAPEQVKTRARNFLEKTKP